MSADIVITLVVTLGTLLALASNRVPAEVAMLAALTCLLLSGVISSSQALAGFSNAGLMTVAVLYVVAAALRDTGAIYWIANRLLGRPKTELASQWRMILPTSLLSAFLNNTTVVAMMLPAVQEWARKLKISPSRLLLPLSYAAILGGTCTLIGTSTNLVVHGMMQQHGYENLRIFDLAWVGIPLLIGGAVFLAFFSRHLLPEREGITEQVEHAREYYVEMLIPTGSPLHQKTIEQAGLRSLSHGFLTDVQRGDKLYSAVSPDMQLHSGDLLGFIGAPPCARELQRIKGLAPAHGNAHKLNINNHQRCLVEVVLGPEFPGINKTVKGCAFRSHYQAAILSVNRDGQRLSGKVGDICLRAGDTLLLETGETFVDQYQFRRDFLLVSPLRDSAPPDFRRAPPAVAILLAMVLCNAAGLLPVLEAALLAGGLLVITGCVSINRARQNLSVNLPVLIVIGAAFALGGALESSGTANWIASSLLGDSPTDPWLALLCVYLVTTLFTELITNNAAAVLVFPIATGVAEQLGVNPMPFIVAVMFGASASFMTPVGYQTNLMVMGPGGYRFTDYLRLGLPMTLISTAITVTLMPLVWPFSS